MLTFQRTTEHHAEQDDDPPSTAAGRPQSADAQELAALLQRVGLGDRDALRTLYTRCAPKLFGLALRILVRKDWAEDVLQESFVNIWRHAGDYRPHLAAPMTWMTTIVRNRALDCLRRQHAERVQESVPLDETHAEVLADHAPGPADLALAGQQARALAECLKRQRERNDLPFVGLIGSKTKWATFGHRLTERGFTPSELGGVTCPIGVGGISGKQPEVIAVAVAGSVLKVRSLLSCSS